MPELLFPPYGEFSRRYNGMVNPAALSPASWRPNLPLAERESTWLEWRQETLALINEVLWPQWDEATGEWHSPDIQSMRSLTEQDFALFEIIGQSEMLDKTPTTSVSANSIPTHREFFIDEDSPGKIGTRYFYYDYTLPKSQLGPFLDGPAAFSRIITTKCGSASIQFKQKIQRPRAYQVAKLMGRSHHWELAITSMTASMSSGHCFEGCFIAAGLYEQWLNEGFRPTQNQVAALQQYGVDIGDRRVFAGVHYPSDNLASWIISLRLVSEVCGDREVAKFLASAIQSKSWIYNLLKSSGSEAYKPALAVVDQLVAQLST